MSRRPLITIAGAVVVAEAVLLVTDTGPNIWLVAALVGLVGLVVWFTITVDRTAERPMPATAIPKPAMSYPDLRTTTLRQALATGRSDARYARRLRNQLVAIIDDELVSGHGIDRQSDPAAARAVLGDELDRFVADVDSRAPLTPHDITRVVTRIEQL